jgi:hypothetical protein
MPVISATFKVAEKATTLNVQIGVSWLKGCLDKR